MTTITKDFTNAEQAHAWLSDNSGLWAGLTGEMQAALYAQLDANGEATTQPPTGPWYRAVVVAA